MGDEGLTSISGGKRLPKHHPRIEALGSIDELISWDRSVKRFQGNSKRIPSCL